MNPIACPGRDDQIGALVMGTVDSTQAAELREHMATCAKCRDIHRHTARVERFLLGAFDEIASNAELPRGPGAGQDGSLVSAGRPWRIRAVLPFRWPFWPIRFLRPLSLAAAIILGIVLVYGWPRPGAQSYGVTFADVIRRIEKARTVKYTRTAKVEGWEPQVSQEVAMEPGRLRRTRADGYHIIYDLVQGKEVQVDPKTRTARVVYAAYHDKERLAKYLTWLETLHKKDAKYLGQSELNGRQTDVFSVSRPFERTTVWADPQTNLPVRVEQVLDSSPDPKIRVPSLTLFLSDFQDEGPAGAATCQEAANSEGSYITLTGPGVRDARMTTTLTDFAWDVPLDETLFRTVPPEGYKVTEVDYGDPPTDEQALIETFRFWADASDGMFPADMDMVFDIRPKLIGKYHKGGPAELEYANALRKGHILVRGLYFVQSLRAMDNWHYAGRDVRLGQADKPTCWWKIEGSENYRVIYGDLTMRDVTADQLPGTGASGAESHPTSNLPGGSGVQSE